MSAPAADVIVAIATPPGRGGIGIVRISGPDISELARAIVGSELPSPGRALHTRFIDADGSALDDGIALYFAAPYSYTGEHVLELQGHGGPAVLATIVRRCVALGARPAEPGEFTRRAFLNDKLDLAQAEAVADLIEADTAATAKAALRSLTGEFSRQVDALLGALIRLRTLIEAAIDFPEEDLDFVEAADARGQLTLLTRQVATILERARQGQMLRDGLRVVLIGRPNVGKSSLLNRLAREDVAIVTPIPGTTRDTVRQRIEIGGMAVQVSDTAGIRDLAEADEVEKIGIERTWSATRTADCAVIVIDDAAGWTAEDAMVAAGLPEGLACLIVHNKIDLSQQSPRVEGRADGSHVFLSARTGEGMDLLASAVLELAGVQQALPDQFIARERHIVALREADARLGEATGLLARQAPALELIAEELRLAQEALGRITGNFSSDDLLGEIFASFCIGK